MASRKSPIQAVPSPPGFRLERPGALYAVRRRGEAYRGEWLPAGEPLPRDAEETFSEGEARLLLAVLRDLEGRASGKGGRPAEPTTTPDGEFIDRAVKQLGITRLELARLIGVQKSVLSRARHSALPAAHRTAIQVLIDASLRR